MVGSLRSRAAFTAKASQPLLDQNLVYVLPVDLGLPLRVPDDDKPLVEIGLERRRIVGADEGEDLLVALLARGVEGGGKQTARDALAPQLEIDVGPESADVIEGARVRSVGLQHLKADDRAIGLTHGNFPDPAILKI